MTLRAFTFAISLAMVCSSAFARDQKVVIDTDLCTLSASPDNFDKKLVRLRAYLSQGFEDSTLHDPDCADEALVNRADVGRVHVWMDYGNSDAKWHRVKGYEPLVDDDQVRAFRKLVRERQAQAQMAAATMVGTFYAGKQMEVNGRKTSLRGFGHLSCCSLLIVSRIETVETDYDPTLFYSDYGWYAGLPPGCISEQMLQVPSHAESIAAQKNLEKEGWRKDPLKVAENHLTVILSGVPIRTGGKTEVLVPGKQDKNARRDDRPREQLLPVLSKAFYKSYEWIEANGTTHFYIVVTRPYWLRPFANSSDDVIWAVEGASVLQCPETQKTR